jgi:F-type H+-transporting ATPase subunit b
MDGLSKLGIDPLSILLYLLNTGLLLIVLIYVLYKPILRYLDERRDQIRRSVHEAQILKEELDKKSVEAEEASKKAEETLKREMENLRKFTEEKRAELTAEMEAARAEMLAKADADITRRKMEILQDAEKATMDLIKKVVLHIVQNKVPGDVVEASIKDSWKQFNSQSH